MNISLYEHELSKTYNPKKDLFSWNLEQIVPLSSFFWRKINIKKLKATVNDSKSKKIQAQCSDFFFSFEDQGSETMLLSCKKQKEAKWEKLPTTIWQGWALCSFPFSTLNSFLFLKKNVPFFSVFFRSFLKFLATYETQKNVPLFSVLF